MEYLLDTNILLTYSRTNAVSEAIEEKYQLFAGSHRLVVSIVTVGELDALIKKFNLGPKRQTLIEGLLGSVAVAGIEYNEVINAYGDIDAYSQRKFPNPGPFTARNMGKNDIWIAATAHVYELTLLTADQDFAHLADTYVDLQQVHLSSF